MRAISKKDLLKLVTLVLSEASVSLSGLMKYFEEEQLILI